ncbi:MAG: hypothetical protein ABH879_01375 [archaeon]
MQIDFNEVLRNAPRNIEDLETRAAGRRREETPPQPQERDRPELRAEAPEVFIPELPEYERTDPLSELVIRAIVGQNGYFTDETIAEEAGRARDSQTILKLALLNEIYNRVPDDQKEAVRDIFVAQRNERTVDEMIACLAGYMGGDLGDAYVRVVGLMADRIRDRVVETMVVQVRREAALEYEARTIEEMDKMAGLARDEDTIADYVGRGDDQFAQERLIPAYAFYKKAQQTESRRRIFGRENTEDREAKDKAGYRIGNIFQKMGLVETALVQYASMRGRANEWTRRADTAYEELLPQREQRIGVVPRSGQ